MSIQTDNPDHGFQFPGVFELSAMGPADKHLEQVLPSELMAAGIDVVSEQINWRHSSSGKYVSVRIAFNAASREDYDRAHAALREHPDVKWTV
jgi:putative lipoic acid-binding regulatory protein